MRAWFVDNPGSTGALALHELQAPEPGPQEVLVDVRAIGINRADILQRKGGYPPPSGFDPCRPGLEYAGQVEAVGERVIGRQAGEPVMGLIGGGAYAEKLVVHERETLTIPGDFDYPRAAAMPEAFLTAYRALYIEGGLQAGQWALIRGATSGVGQAALQLVSALGARSIATSRTAERLDELTARFQALGLSKAFDIGLVDGEQGVAEAVQQRTGGAQLIVDFIGAPVLADNLAALRDEGRQVQVGVIGGATAEINMATLLMRRLGLAAMTMRSLPIERRIELAQIFNDRLLPLFNDGQLRPVLDQTFDFEQATAAHEAMEAGRHLGKLVLVRDYESPG